VSLSPLSDRAEIALMMAQFHSGRMDAAISAGNRALSLNLEQSRCQWQVCNGAVFRRLLGGGRFDGRGRWKIRGRGSARRRTCAALDAYRRGDWPKASLHVAEQVNCSGFVGSDPQSGGTRPAWVEPGGTKDC